MATVSINPSIISLQLQERFAALVEPYRSALDWYCRSITGSAWEADDLVQDTWLKAFAMFKREPYRNEMSKAYLFRIASNTWIDRFRRSRLTLNPIQDELHALSESNADPIEIRDAMEKLVAHLPPRQQVILLLVDVYQFTASEVADMIKSTESAVKASLHRARTKMKSLQDEHREDDRNELNRATAQSRKIDEKLVYAYLEAFERQNPYAMLMVQNDAAPLDVVPKVQGSRKASPAKDRDALRGLAANRHVLSYLSAAA